MAQPFVPAWCSDRGWPERSKLGLIAIARGDHLVDLGLVGPRIDLREQVAGVHGLPFGEVDADDLSLDLAADDDRIIGDDRADAGANRSARRAGDHSSDDRHRWIQGGQAAPIVRMGNDG